MGTTILTIGQRITHEDFINFAASHGYVANKTEYCITDSYKHDHCLDDAFDGLMLIRNNDGFVLADVHDSAQYVIIDIYGGDVLSVRQTAEYYWQPTRYSEDHTKYGSLLYFVRADGLCMFESEAEKRGVVKFGARKSMLVCKGFCPVAVPTAKGKHALSLTVNKIQGHSRQNVGAPCPAFAAQILINMAQ